MVICVSYHLDFVVVLTGPLSNRWSAGEINTIVIPMFKSRRHAREHSISLG